MDNICILLSTYNGEKYLGQQIDSILSQNYSNWNLWIRDDGSSDSTINIIANYLEKDERIRQIPSSENFGLIRSFFTLVDDVTIPYDYYMFCDQDDVWRNDKIALTLNEMKKVETCKTMPTLIYTDLIITDKALHPIAQSMFEFQKISPQRNKLSELVVQNVITGCTTMFNSALKIKIKYDDTILMHDQWLGLIASAFGNIGFISESTIYYRQHGKNVVGAQKRNFSNLLAKIQKKDASINNINRSFSQAQAFFNMYKSDLSEEQRTFLLKFAQFPQSKFWQRFQILTQFRLKKNTFSRTIIYYYLMLWKI